MYIHIYGILHKEKQHNVIFNLFYITEKFCEIISP